uniref:Glutamate-rich 3 n=1 Tax=Poecilia formosa TaxID=48698 RepID=A0A096MF22_POEFO
NQIFSGRFLPAYNSLTDKHLADYFSNSRIRKHLLRAGLITRSGRIVPEKEYRHKLIQTANQNHVQECLAQAIVHKVLEREHYHQIDVKRKQVEFEKKQRVQRFKVERCKKYEEEMIRALTPCPPTTSRSIWEQLSGPLGKHFAPCDIPSLTRPSTAPGKMQRPVRLKPIHRRSSTALPRHISPYRKSLSFLESQPYNCLANFKSRRRFTTKDIYPGLDSFCLPVTKNFIIPTPPAVPPTGAPSSTIRGRRLRPSTSSSGVEYPSRLKGSIHQSRVQVTMVYFGKLVHLSDHPSVIRDEIKVLQQHCGGENLCVYQGKLREGDVFQFLSRRHRGYPFSLTFYQNGLLVERLSSCCEYKHSKGSRIGGRNGLFGFSSMEGATPCYKCIVAMGVDKLPIPPPKKVNGDLSLRKQSATSLKDENEMEADTTEEVAVSKQEYESYRSPEMDTTAIEQTASVESNIINGIVPKTNYEEDFEADNESSMEETTPQEMKSQIQGEEAEACRYKETSGETTIPSEDEEREDNTEEDNQAEDAAPDRKLTQDEARTQGDKSEEPGEAHLPVDGDVAQDDKIEDPFERNELADVEASHSDEDQVPETGVPESDAEEADGSMVKHDEAASTVSEPETFGAEIQEERNANEEVEEVENENKAESDFEN